MQKEQWLNNFKKFNYSMALLQHITSLSLQSGHNLMLWNRCEFVYVIKNSALLFSTCTPWFSSNCRLQILLLDKSQTDKHYLQLNDYKYQFKQMKWNNKIKNRKGRLPLSSCKSLNPLSGKKAALFLTPLQPFASLCCFTQSNEHEIIWQRGHLYLPNCWLQVSHFTVDMLQIAI